MAESDAEQVEWLAARTLANGTVVRFRYVRPEDEPLISDAIRTASRETLLHRFFSPIRSVAPELLRQMLALDAAREKCIVGVTEGDFSKRPSDDGIARPHPNEVISPQQPSPGLRPPSPAPVGEGTNPLPRGEGDSCAGSEVQERVLAQTSKEAFRKRIICGARYVRLPGDVPLLYSDAAEIAITVHDEFQHCGLGTLLLELLTKVARKDGIRRFEADVMASNVKMQRLFKKVFPKCTGRWRDGDVMHFVARLGGGEK